MIHVALIRVAYLWRANGVAKSPLWAAVERALERSGTARNITTFTKVIALMEGRTRSKAGASLSVDF